MSGTKPLSETHWEILGIQNSQLRSKAKELRFIAKNVERIIELMYQRAEESREGYAERDAYNLWRGHSIDTYVMRTNWDADLSAYHTAEKEASN